MYSALGITEAGLQTRMTPWPVPWETRADGGQAASRWEHCRIGDITYGADLPSRTVIAVTAA